MLKNSVSKRPAGAILVAVILAVCPGWILAGEAKVDPEAQNLLKKSTDFLAAQEQFSLEARYTIEAVMEDGQKLQFDAASTATLMRPNKLYAVRVGDIADQELLYDGASITLHDIDAGYYATVEAPDTLEGMFDFARENLDIVAPAGDFLYTNAFDILMDGVGSGFVVGESFVAGAMCDHIAFSKPGTDFQVWIQQGDEPLVRRLVITSRDVKSAPQYSVEITNWNLAPEVTADQFQFVQPENSQAIEFIFVDESEN